MKLTTTLLALALSTGISLAQTTTTEETTTTTDGAGGTTTTTTTQTSTGTLHEYSPGKTFIVKETSGPMNYRYGQSVTYVTKSGQTLTEEQVRTRVKVGVPVSVQYATEGETRVVNRIIIAD
ncbi:hypothetical protein FEM03_17500 [Phragmitibacter flavus]|uniref:DUF5666 domain-containing protein n=1 Tax=Phragmitibacter flavus TaxID=2576071 RepID=A0A5R8KCX1_9BACT|nr:hypothetical protein [Phragmitibacter flavus]TLD69439.1 hypothetical protein FEM03_17500 [Phragmitibacter flavus]